MSRNFFIIVSLAIFCLAIVVNINASIGINHNNEVNITLSSVEALVMGECTASANKCPSGQSASCTGKNVCVSGDTHVYCDGVFVYCN